MVGEPVGRPFHAIGIWPDMIRAAGGVQPLADALCLSSRRLRRVFLGLGSIGGARTVLARNFANSHGITLKCYVHPTRKQFYLLSGPSGWLSIPASPGGWRYRAKVQKSSVEDWSRLADLEVDFALVWDLIAPIGRDVPKDQYNERQG